MTAPSTETVTEAVLASAEGGLVFLDGPHGIAWTLTPDAAEAVAHALLAAAAEARGQAAARVGAAGAK